MLQSEGIESHVVDAASILTSRRRRRAKTDRIDGETLVRTLMAFKRGEPRVCSMARAPTPQEEDRRRVCRERRTLVGERVKHVNRIKGLLFAQGVFGYEPLRKGRRERLEDLRTGDGRPLPVRLKAQIIRELDRLEVVLESATVTLHLADGTEHIRHGRGTPGRPMSDAELDAKVRELATYGAPFVDAAGLIAAVRGIEDEADPTRLLRLTVPA